MKHCFILNPAAGKGAGALTLREKIEECGRQRQCDVEIYLTAGIGDATEYIKRRVAAEPEESYRFYACGGDGTLGEAVCGVMSLENRERVALGLIPSGTGNDFVRNFEGGDRFFDIDAQLSAAEQAVDLLSCNDRYAINMVNIGFDCEVVVKTVTLKKKAWVPKGAAYVIGLVMTLIRKPGMKARISLDGEEPKEGKYLLSTYANGCFCGGGFHSNPKSLLNDGQMDVLLVNPIGRLKFLSIVGQYKAGTHLNEKNRKILSQRKCRQVRIFFEKETNVSVDGELISVKELMLKVEREALRFLVPKGASLRACLPCEERAEAL